MALQRWVKLDHEIVRFKPAWEKVHYIEAEIKGLKELEGARYNYVPPSGKGCGYHTIGLQLNFDHKTEAEVETLVKSLRRDNPEVWVRYWRGRNSFIINTLNLVDGDEKITAERIKKVFG